MIVKIRVIIFEHDRNGTLAASRADRQNKHVIADRQNKRVIFKNCVLFTDCISEINYTQIDEAKNHQVFMSLYDLLKCRDNY